ncbi:alpha-amylase [Prevotella intermedia]|uniref:alpha-amylase family glycosyl hydrolase n=1 Tax=Prevotella intermedia TaxID=28131 RepID=UPI000B4DDA21|nr:alpha-amylase family glycosyl hydrolase [Prevotella intermedia]OWP33473.1 alpha-amylase [Prevotella intermedia]
MKRTSTLLAALCLAMAMFAQGWKANYGGVMLQGFYWDSYQDTKWTNLEAQAKEFSDYFDLVWLPQSAQARNNPSMGYDDYYWFSNYNSSFGTEAELLSLIGTFKANGIKTIADVVINHRATTAGWFNFPTETYNNVTYTMTSKDVAKNDDGGEALKQAQKEGVQLSDFMDSGEDWPGMRDLDHNSANVQATVKAYLQMLKDKFGYAGFRYDMVKGYGGKFTALYNNASQPEFSVGEYWDGDINKVKAWIESTKSDNVPTSAAFDFPIRYTVRNAVNNGNWSAFDGIGLAKDPNYARYAVTFVENHDTEDRGGNSHQDPIKKDTLAANAYILAMPGTPSIFLKHYQAYKSDIKNMISVRKLMGINNESKAAKYSSSSDYYAFTTTGTNGEMLTVLGPAKSFSNTNRWIKLTGGYHWAYYVEKSKANFVWASLASGTYDGEQSVTLTAISDDANAQIVYTTDGSEPTAGSAKATNGQVLTIPVGTTVLKAGLLVGGIVKNVIVRNYNIIDFKPYNIKVYVNADDSDAAWASAKMTSTNPSINFWIWGGTHKTVKGSWPGDAVTTTETANGKKWFVKEFAITNSNDIVNLVFSVGTGSPQTVDIENIKATTFISISSEKEGGKNKVNVVSTGIDNIVAEQKGNNDPYYYTLSGQRIAKPTQRGIYIHNGKKVLVK